MTTDTNTAAAETGPYSYHLSQDGCDAIYFIEHRDGTTVLGLYFWDNLDEVEAKARAIVNALNMPGGWVNQYHVTQSTLRENRLIATIWSDQHVLDLRPDLTEDQAWEVLQKVEKKSPRRITKSALRREARILFPRNATRQS